MRFAPPLRTHADSRLVASVADHRDGSQRPSPPCPQPAARFSQNVESDADAAAGGPAASTSDSDASSVHCGLRGYGPKMPPGGFVQLPIQATAGSSIASASAVQLQRDLSDVDKLQSNAAAALKRISQQQAALRRFPVACPACGTLNAPSGLAWGVNDIAICQGCRQNFVPLGHGLQDSDLQVLRTAMQQFKILAARSSYLEQVQNAQVLDERRPPVAEKSPKAFGPAHFYIGDDPDLTSRYPQATHSPRRARSKGSPHLGPSAPPSGEPVRRRDHSRGGERDLDRRKDQPREMSLVSFMDTLELLTNSSVESLPGVCINGFRIQHQNLSPKMQAAEALRAAASAAQGRRLLLRQREEGEITASEAASEDERGLLSMRQSVRDSSPKVFSKPPCGHNDFSDPRVMGAKLMPVETPDEVPQFPPLPLRRADNFAGGLHLRTIGFISILLTCYAILRLVLATLPPPAAPALASAVLAVLVVSYYDAALRNLTLFQQMDTSPEHAKGCVVTITLGGRYLELASWDLHVEEVLGGVCVCCQLLLLCFFESWGSHSHDSIHRAAVSAHSASSIAFHLCAHNRLSRLLGLPEVSSHNGLSGAEQSALPLWLCLAAGNWATSTLSSFTWWRLSTASSAPPFGSFSGHGQLAILATLVTQVANAWLLRRRRMWLVLAVLLFMVGVSLACSCHRRNSVEDIAMNLPSCAHHRQLQACVVPPGSHLDISPAEFVPGSMALYVVFCVISALLLWQELIGSL